MKLGGTSAAGDRKLVKKEAPTPVDNLRKVRRFGWRIAPSHLENVRSRGLYRFYAAIDSRRRLAKIAHATSIDEKTRSAQEGRLILIG
jgi:hypothetical protein